MPLAVRMRFIQPWVRFRFKFLGWYSLPRALVRAGGQPQPGACPGPRWQSPAGLQALRMEAAPRLCGAQAATGGSSGNLRGESRR